MTLQRRWMGKILKVIFVLSTACFLLIQIHTRRRTSFESLDSEKNGLAILDGRDRSVGDEFSSMSLEKLAEKFRSSDNRKDGRLIIKKNNKTLTTLILERGAGEGGRTAEPWEKPQAAAHILPDADEIRKSVEDNNANAPILNDAEFSSEEIAHVIVVQVHNRSKYLEKLIQSIGEAANISRTLLIFSHDHISSQIDNLVQSIKFCRVMQIYYPYSMQIYKDVFPGQDPKDCPPKIGKAKAEEMKCQNWEHPDKYNNYRLAKLSQVKHHWWWKINYVFDGINRLKNYTGWVLLLEEDHYVSPDFLYVFEQIIRRKKELCDECSIISLGFYLKNYDDYSRTLDKLCVFPWFSSRHNMGMAMNRDTWNRIHSCSKHFCQFDDYNWDWSLMHVNLKCVKPPPFRVIYAKAPRVFHIGDCGMHHTGKTCTADASATKAASIINAARRRLFPSRMVVSERSSKTLKAPKENGGWGDVRDHRLCMLHASNVRGGGGDSAR